MRPMPDRSGIRKSIVLEIRNFNGVLVAFAAVLSLIFLPVLLLLLLVRTSLRAVGATRLASRLDPFKWRTR